MNFNFFARSLISENIRNLVLDKDPRKLRDIIEDNSCKTAVKALFHPLIEYLIENKLTLIKYIFDDEVYNENKKISMFSYELIVLKDNLVILKSLTVDELELISNYVFSNNVDSIKLNRFAEILKYLIYNECNVKLDDIFEYIWKFSDYINYGLVYNLFECLFVKDDYSLDDVDFSKYFPRLMSIIKREISSFDPNMSEDINDIQCLKASSYYNLLTSIYISKKYAEDFDSNEFVKLLAKDYINKPLNVMNSQWDCLSNILNNNNIIYIENIKEKLLDFLPKEGDKLCHQYQCSVILVISKLCRLNIQNSEYFINNNFHIIANRLLKQFPHHTFLHQTILKAFVHSEILNDFEKITIKEIINTVNTCLSDDENFLMELRAFSFNFVEELKERSVNILAIETDILSLLTDKSNKTFEDMKAVKDSDYGGHVPEVIQEDSDFLSEEQMKMFLKRITMIRR